MGMLKRSTSRTGKRRLPLALTIFGVGSPSKPPSFCYAVLRTVRGNGGYPPPSLPQRALLNSGTCFRLAPSAIDLSIWDRVFDREQEAEVEAELARGRFIIPPDSPIEPGIVLNGASFAPVLLTEKNNRVVCDGAGALWSSGFVVSDGADRIIQCLRAATGRDEIGAELDLTLRAIEGEAGLGSLVTETRRLGIIERLRREHSGHRPALLSIRVIKPELNGQEPCRQIVLYRDAAPLDQSFQVHLTLLSWNSVVLNRLVNFPAGIPELIVEASTHVTSIKFAAFGTDKDDLVDQLEVSLLQSVNGNLVGQTRTDYLPELFKGAPHDEELENRRRIHTGSFAGPTAGNRAQGFDQMRHNHHVFDSLIGEQSWRGETKWFDAGAEPQVNVIRWMKSCLEDVNVNQSFLVDPYLGSDALKRVILRHGNETVSLDIVVSPGDVNPDSKELDAKGDSSDHVAALVAAANELTHQLCGTIRILHVKRGTGRRQAFHDRYFGLIGRDGVPRVYLLSNSLSKAAGDWPFVATELDRVASWNVNAYVRGLLNGDDRGRSLIVDEVWPTTATASSETSNEVCTEQSEEITNTLTILKQVIDKAYMALHAIELRGGNSAHEEISDTINVLISEWPNVTDSPETIARILVEAVGGREQHAAAISDKLKLDSNLQAVAQALDKLLVERLLGRLVPADKSLRSLSRSERVDLLRRAGRLIAIGERGTDYVRNSMNPALHQYINLIEAGRSGDSRRPFEMLRTGLNLVLIGLEVAFSAKDAPVQHRIGLATDYIHFLGRLLRSWVSEEWFVRPPRAKSLPCSEENHVNEALGLAKALHAELGSDLDAAFERLVADSMLPNIFTKLLLEKLADPMQNAAQTEV